MKNYESSTKAFATGVIGFILTLILIALTHNAHSQSIGLGLGKASDGRTTAKMYFITPSGFGAYVCHYADDYDYDQDLTTVGYLSNTNRVTTIGITARIHSWVTVYAGAGTWFCDESYNDASLNRYYKKYDGKCIEAGAIMEVWQCGRFTLHVDASLNSTGQVNSMILCTVNFYEP